jgi:ComF family protein
VVRGAALLLDALLPARCAGCGRFGGVRKGLCGPCSEALGAPLATGDVLALGGYWRHLDGVVRALKFHGRRELAVPLGVLLAEGVREAGWSIESVVAVPLHAARQHERGFNQAALLADVIAGSLGVPYVAALERRRNTVHQPGSSRSQRAANVHGAFRCVVTPLAGQVLLVDDVFTTGATYRECARTLRAAGAARVRAAVVARA